MGWRLIQPISFNIDEDIMFNSPRQCDCGFLPDLEEIRYIGEKEFKFQVKCHNCGKCSGRFIEEESAVIYWNSSLVYDVHFSDFTELEIPATVPENIQLRMQLVHLIEQYPSEYAKPIRKLLEKD